MGPNGQPANCGLVDVGCQLGNAANDAITNMARAAAASAADLAAQSATFWINVPSPDVSPSSPSVAFVQGHLYWYMSAAAVFSVMYAAIKVMREQRLDAANDLATSLFRLVMINGAGLPVLAGLILAADAFAKWIIDQSTQDFGKSMTEALHIQDANINFQMAFIVLIIAVLAICGSAVQIVLLIVRNGFLTVLAGVWPTTAALSNTDMGHAWYKRTTSWLIAYLLYKPVSAIIYATAFTGGKTIGQGGGDPIVNAITSLALMFMSIIALPALLRFTAPVLESVTNRGGGATSTLAMALPTGAALLGGGGGPSGAASGGGSWTPPPPAPAPVGAAPIP